MTLTSRANSAPSSAIRTSIVPSALRPTTCAIRRAASDRTARLVVFRTFLQKIAFAKPQNHKTAKPQKIGGFQASFPDEVRLINEVRL